MNLENPHSRFDIDHEKYGRVNVKSLNSRTGRWRFPSLDNCDYVAAVAMKGNVAEFVNLIPSSALPRTITNDNRVDGDIIVLKQSLYL